MIVYNRLWATMKARNISQYKLIHQYHISTGQLDRLRKNGNVSTYTLDQLCSILNCQLSDIAEFCPTPAATPERHAPLSDPVSSVGPTP